MRTAELRFERPDGLEATEPPEARGERRDDVRLLVSTPAGHSHASFRDFSKFLDPGDLIVVNDSATLPASLSAKAEFGGFRLNISTRFGPKLWLTEPRWATDRPGPLPLEPGDHISACDQEVRLISPYPGTERLWFVEGDLAHAMARCGEPIRYAYVEKPQPLTAYQTLFARAPGSAEMPNAGRPFTRQIMAELLDRGIRVATIRLHTGVSSLEIETEEVEEHTLPPEPFRVGADTTAEVNDARERGKRVVAIGTTVVRALESAWSPEEGKVVPRAGFTRLLVSPERGTFAVDGMLTGLHDPMASHLAMLYAVAGKDLVREGYKEAVLGAYKWHEFGDSHLLLPR